MVRPQRSESLEDMDILNFNVLVMGGMVWSHRIIEYSQSTRFPFVKIHQLAFNVQVHLQLRCQIK